MKLFRVFICLVTNLIILSAVSVAQPPTPCNPCVTYCTWTQGGWGADCHGGNVGCLRDQYFNAIYPNGVTIGHCYPACNYWIHLTSSARVDSFLPQGSTPAPLAANYTNPPRMPLITVFAGQVLALQLNVDYSAYPPAGLNPIGGLVIGSGPFAGMTVNTLLALGNDVLGGNLGALPPGTTIAELNAACDSTNQNFDGCTHNNGYVVIPPQGETVIARDYGEVLPLSFCLNFTVHCSDICVMWWCQGCNESQDFAFFSSVPGCAGPECSQNCTPNTGVLTGFETQNQSVIGPDPSGNGCWWYALVHATAPGCFCVTFESQLPVELMDFAAIAGNGEVNLNWATASETNNSHFNIVRSTDGSSWSTIGRVDGQGTVTGTTHYNFVDNSVTNGIAYGYKLMAVDMNGVANQVSNAISATPSAGAATPQVYALRQNYPNPFNPTTSISFDLVESGNVTLKVYNMIGQEVAALVNSHLSSGRHSVSFDGRNLPSALYIYRLEANGYTDQRKMLLIK